MGSAIESRSTTFVPTVADHKKRAFLKALARTGNPVKAANAVGWRSTDYPRRLYKTDPQFREDFDHAMEVGGDVFEGEAVRRAVDGIRRPVFYKGGIVGYVQEYSDGLLTTLLRGAKPDKYAERRKSEVEVTGGLGVALIPAPIKSESEWESLARGVKQDQQEVIDAEFEEVESIQNKGPVEIRRG